MGEWIAWEGGECPVEWRQRVQVKYRNGMVTRVTFPRQYNWHHNSPIAGPFDIVAYRLSTPTTKPRSAE